MKHLHKIAFFPLFAALLLAACDRNRHTPDPDTQKAPISFAAMSQNIPVKAGETALSSIHQNFGIWGYATREGQMDYLIWEQNYMSPVTYNGSSFYPDTYAFWLSGYDYNFIAIAPYTDGAKKLSDFQVGAGKDALTFAYDMSDIYSPSEEGAASKPGIDLMASIAKAHVDKAASQGVQDLTFHRLTSRIDIKVKFQSDEGNDIFESTSVTGMRLERVGGDASYSISYSSEGDIAINCAIGETSDSEIPLTLTEPDPEGWRTVTAYILPQSVTNFKLYMDFKLGDVAYENFPITPTFPAGDTNYGINQWHTWKITLTPSLFVLFETSVTDWGDGGQADDEIGFN